MSPAQALSFESFRPTPERLWIRHRPRRWPSPPGDWTDWARRSMGRPGRAGAELPETLTRPFDDVVYLPPVTEELRTARDDLAGAWREKGVPLIVQRLPEEEAGGDEVESAVWDLLPALLQVELDRLAGVPRGAAVVWPLVGGLTDDEDLVEKGLALLATRRVETVHPMVLELSASARRHLARDADEATFDKIFHGSPPSTRGFSSRVVAHGLSPFLQRPLPLGPSRLTIRRRCAGELRLAAELYHLLGRPEVEAQRLLRSARWIDREDHDLAALAAESNLTIVDWFDSTSRRLIEEVLSEGSSALVAGLKDEYTRPEALRTEAPG